MTRKLTLYPFLFVILLAPLPFASNRPWSWTLLSLLVGILVLWEMLSSGGESRNNRRFMKRMIPGVALFGLAILWIVFQMTDGMLFDLAHPLWQETSKLLSLDVASTISLDPEAGIASLTRLLSYCGVFWIGARLGRDPENAEFMLKAFVVASCFYGAYGLFVYFAELKSVLWYEKWAYQNDLTSTFINRNSYATFAGLGLIVSGALMFQLLGRRLRGAHTRRAMILDFADRAFRQAWLPILGIFITTFALLLTHSRGGLLSSGVGLFILLGSLTYARVIPRKVGVSLNVIIFLICVLIFILAGNAVDVRLANTSLETSIRDDLFATILDAVSFNPYLGTGYGTFEQAFMPHKTFALSFSNWDKAHNSYLELAFELGIPATLAIVSTFVWFAGVCIHGLVKRNRRHVFAAIGLSATMLVGTHALVDFSLQIPGFTVGYILIVSIAWAQSWPTPRSASRTSNNSDDADAGQRFQAADF